ncbi:organomercurial lyase [Saccharolobus shibatae]|uniref:Uncharacterized protein n=1 Tax=Saccharolobus shibatae TaxID=2286 RepID=A0A8F5C1K6_9CREN|nr:organomercurial lyase [Saccharolobus shibatae]QXJ35305.1 hypothetical protein J5U22_01852 [Saccharolobus shibatae]
MRSTEEVLKRIVARKPTNFKIIDEHGKEVYVYCAWDAILYAILTNNNIEVETILSDKNNRFKLDKNTELIVSFVDPHDEEKFPITNETPSNLCPYLRFFTNLEEFESWRNSLPEGIRRLIKPMRVREAFSMIQQYLNNV